MTLPLPPRRVVYVADRLTRALVARDAAEEGRARLADRSRQIFEAPSSDRSTEYSASEAAGVSAGRRDARLSHAEHEVKMIVLVWFRVVVWMLFISRFVG